MAENTFFNEKKNPKEDFIPATIAEQREEACKRLYIMTGKMPEDIKIKPRNSNEEKALEAFRKETEKLGLKAYPYAILPLNTIVYVSENKEQWEYERSLLTQKGENRDGLALGYVYNAKCPELSEFGEIGYSLVQGTLLRTV